MNKPSLRNAVLLGLLATAGIARPAEVFAWEGIYGGINAGWAFDRQWFEGETLQDRGSSLDIADGPFAGVQFEVRF
mgnify:CR=1 FL=1